MPDRRTLKGVVFSHFYSSHHHSGEIRIAGARGGWSQGITHCQEADEARSSALFLPLSQTPSPTEPAGQPRLWLFNISFVEIENTHNVKTLSNCMIPSFLVYSQNYGTIATISEHRGETAERLTAPISLSEPWDLCQIPANGSQCL